MIVRKVLIRTTVAMTPEGKSKLTGRSYFVFCVSFSPLFKKGGVIVSCPFFIRPRQCQKVGPANISCVLTPSLSMPIVFHLEGFELDFVEFDTIRKVGLVSGLHPKLLEDGLAPGHLL